eukprot:maker-scaffold_6-snap-gene-0.51-mRNA-1 protein AED:0.00 eAED:0.00 QI:185/1/1/1/1/1/2/1465/339
MSSSVIGEPTPEEEPYVGRSEVSRHKTRSRSLSPHKTDSEEVESRQLSQEAVNEENFEQKLNLPVRLFVGQVPETFLDSDIYNLFAAEKITVLDISIIRDKNTGRHRHCSFVTVGSRKEADLAVKTFHNKRYLKAMSNPMQVKEANAPKSSPNRTQNSIQTTVNQLSPPLNHSFAPQNQFGAYFYPNLTNYYFSNQTQRIPNVPNLYSTNAVPAKKSYIEGPNGANLFINNLPENFGDNELKTLFEKQGNILSWKVFVDRHTKKSKGFGFVSFSTGLEAHNAIKNMNGFIIQGRKLVVEPKRVKQFSYGSLNYFPWQGLTPSLGQHDEARNIFNDGYRY